jgi:hypothetical protein
MSRNYSDFIRRKETEWGKKFTQRSLAKKFIPYYENQKRIEVKFDTGEIKRGTVGVTTGWAPVFLLILRRNSMGSIWILHSEDKIVKVIS